MLLGRHSLRLFYAAEKFLRVACVHRRRVRSQYLLVVCGRFRAVALGLLGQAGFAEVHRSGEVVVGSRYGFVVEFHSLGIVLLLDGNVTLQPVVLGVDQCARDTLYGRIPGQEFGRLYMETLIERHGAIMDEYDPDKKVGMIVDEWGTWYTCEPGTNPGFLYQQNTVRDALVAGITLNIFNKHSDRVKMAALAQMVNVLQSVLLTEGGQMIKTPTYHVMHMYRHHQGADLLESTLTGAGEIGPDEWKVPKITESVSMDKDGVITVTMNNLSVEASEKVEIQLANRGYHVVEARIVTDSDMHAHNTFEAPDTVTEKDFAAYEETENGLNVTMPANSVIELRLAK